MLAPLLSALPLVLASLTPATVSPAENTTTLLPQQVSDEASLEVIDRMILECRTP